MVVIEWCGWVAKTCVSSQFQVIKPVLSLGVLAELWLEFPGFEVAALTVLARVLLEMYPLFHPLD